jgi:hypothetical protein
LQLLHAIIVFIASIAWQLITLRGPLLLQKLSSARQHNQKQAARTWIQQQKENTECGSRRAFSPSR